MKMLGFGSGIIQLNIWCSVDWNLEKSIRENGLFFLSTEMMKGVYAICGMCYAAISRSTSKVFCRLWWKSWISKQNENWWIPNCTAKFL